MSCSTRTTVIHLFLERASSRHKHGHRENVGPMIVTIRDQDGFISPGLMKEKTPCIYPPTYLSPIFVLLEGKLFVCCLWLVSGELDLL